MIRTLLVFLFAYLAGSVNFAIIFFRLTGREDPRLSYSGNAGTTNVYRQAGMGWAAVIFLLDLGRAMAVAVVTCYYLKVSLLPWAAFFLILGNSFPCFHGFRGGKGVANYLGYTLLISPWTAAASAAAWLAAYGVFRVTFIASFFMVFILAVGQAHYGLWKFGAVSGALASLMLIVFNHRVNIRNYRKPAPISPEDNDEEAL
ncbi:MAG TPA: glycerol-3-phosphate acyltransferase [Smithellaceae bacterium]|nr:glycerol-3-phosphate acyltransferase [Smithellaceae bacterium]HRS90051.1 glycerol-3-phosphate acyltransferase [Smithellaceae bacterium]HRV26901.1 glycerol-3-phosphate acyltransferase [Smithellaceae bacterium]